VLHWHFALGAIIINIHNSLLSRLRMMDVMELASIAADSSAELTVTICMGCPEDEDKTRLLPDRVKTLRYRSSCIRQIECIADTQRQS
jgi:hypothetical protein